MTDQSPTAAFTASSFLDGANADYVDQLAARHAADPASVDPQWAEIFKALGDSELDAKRAAKSKIEAMLSAGIVVADSPAKLGAAVLKAIG